MIYGNEANNEQYTTFYNNFSINRTPISSKNLSVKVENGYVYSTGYSLPQLSRKIP